MTTLMEIARRVVAQSSVSEVEGTAPGAGGKGDKGEKDTDCTPFSPLSRFPPADGIKSPTTLVGLEPWNTRVALQLIHDADALVERFGVSGRHPAVRDAAALVTSALATRDLETLRFAVAEFAALLRALASERLRAGAVGDRGANTVE